MSNLEIEDTIEECVIIKVKDIPEHMAGLDLTWLDREIRKIKEKLLNKLTSNNSNKKEGGE